MPEHRVRKSVANHDAVAPFDDDEFRADHGFIGAQMQTTRRPVERAVQARQHLVFARHVVRARRNGTQRRTPQHELARTETQSDT